EAWSSSPELAKLYSGPNRHELFNGFLFLASIDISRKRGQKEKTPLKCSKAKRSNDRLAEIDAK
ncbi:hypothetical protein NE652_12010, partial [Bifidobacterium pseudocatenulatum]|nr:hypothetical protein [Bifidobacterium pseudocatenulatum]